MYRYAHFKYPAVNTGVGYIGWIVQHVGADIGGEYQGLTASVSAVDDVVNVFKSVFCSSLRAKIVNDEQRKTAQTLNRVDFRGFFALCGSFTAWGVLLYGVMCFSVYKALQRKTSK